MAATIEGVPEDITAGISEDAGRRGSDGKFATVWIELHVDGDDGNPERVLTPSEARLLARRLFNLALEADQISSSVRR
jgi:hypothetical protein